MYIKKGICFLLFATAALALPVGLNHFQQENSRKVQADGGAPPVGPPKKLLRTGKPLNADVALPTSAASHLARA